MPNHPDWPILWRSFYNALFGLVYAMVAVAGLDLAFGMGPVPEPQPSLGLIVIGIVAGVAGSVGVAAVVFRRWMVEWVAAGVLTAMLGAYTVIDWLDRLFRIGYPPLPMVAVAVIAGAAMVAAIATGKRRWRWVAVIAALVVLALAVPLSARNPATLTAATALLGARCVEWKVFSDSVQAARRLRPGVAPALGP